MAEFALAKKVLLAIFMLMTSSAHIRRLWPSSFQFLCSLPVWNHAAFL